jgi:parallel beta-helix repeat protein
METDMCFKHQEMELDSLWGGVTNITIENTTITNNLCGISLGYSYGDNIYANDIIGNVAGIIAMFSSVSIVTNSITNNEVGISLGYTHCVITGNYIAASQYGIMMQHCTGGNTIASNSIANNHEGITFAYCGLNNLIENNITNNDVGFGIDIGGNNVLYRNNFMGNLQQIVENARDMWDNGYPSGGNYWSDYNGTDSYSGPYQNETGSDGIGDTPYTVSAYSHDNYPLMSPWVHIVCDLNDDGKVSLADLILLAQAYGSKPGNPNWNPFADIAPPYGIISLTDLVTMAMHYGQHNP